MILNDVCELIVDTEHKTAPTQEKGYPSIRTPNIGKGRFILEGVNRVSEDTYQKWTRRAIPQAGDLILAREAPVGNVAVIPEGETFCLGQRTVLLRPNINITEPRYLCYYLLGDEIRNSMLSRSGGATVAHLNMKDIRALELGELPPLHTQRKIASILSAYDDLIENNTKRIKLLEEAAQNIYKEWFVHFRFPGYEKAQFKDGLPVGWRKEKTEEFFDIKIGKTPPRKESEWFNDPSSFVKWVSISDIGKSNVFVSDTKETITENGVSQFNMNIASVGTVILSFKLTVGKVAIVTENMATNEAIAHFNVKAEYSINNTYAYFYLKLFEYNNLGSTSSIGNAINSKVIKAMPFVLPDKKVLSAYSVISTPIFEQIENLLKQNQQLKEARDILLPRLMNRTIEVSAEVEELVEL